MLVRLEDGWRRFGGGRRWRCAGPGFLCEVDQPGSVPTALRYRSTSTAIRRIHAAYDGRLSYGALDEHGTALDLLTANALTESLGTVEMPGSPDDLRSVYDGAPGIDAGARLDCVATWIGDRAKYLVRREPGYANPVATPGRVSVGTHHMLVSTALDALGRRPRDPRLVTEREVEIVCRLGGDALWSAQRAIDYFTRRRPEHENEPPLLAATYNAGSPRPDAGNPWNLRQYGNHLDRWVAFYNSSRVLRGAPAIRAR